MLPAPVFAQADAVGSAFNALPAADRQKVQQELLTGGFYDGTVDGQYGPRSARSIADAAQYVADNSRGAAVYDLRSTDGAARFLRDVVNGEAAKWLYGEGAEGD